MDRRLLATAAVALLAATGGCSLLGNGTTTPGAGDGPTATPTAAPFTYPEGFAASGVTDAEAAVATHEDAITALDSFTVTYHATIETVNETIRVDYDQPSDLADQEALIRFNVTSDEQFYGSTTQYHTGDTVYVRSRGENQTIHRNESRQFNGSTLTARQFVRPLLTEVAYGEATIVQRDGEPMARYRATGLENASAVFGQGVATENVTAFSATLFVDGDGVVRRIEYSATIDRGDSTRTVDATVAVTAVGETTVERPDWVDKA